MQRMCVRSGRVHIVSNAGSETCHAYILLSVDRDTNRARCRQTIDHIGHRLPEKGTGLGIKWHVTDRRQVIPARSEFVSEAADCS